MEITLAENMKVVTALAPGEGTGLATFSQGICLKYVHRLFIIVNYVDTGIGATITIWRDTDVGMATPDVALWDAANPPKLWANNDTDISDTLVRQADAIGWAFNDGSTSQQVVFQLNPADLGTTAAGLQYDCCDVYFNLLPVNEWASVTYVAHTRYPQGTPPSIIVN